MALPILHAEDMCSACCKTHSVNTMIECDKCLRGYHMGCLKPPLKKVPEVRGSSACGTAEIWYEWEATSLPAAAPQEGAGGTRGSAEVWVRKNGGMNTDVGVAG
jgi:hypothetical protein